MPETSISKRVGEAVSDFLTNVPTSREPAAGSKEAATVRAQAIAREAAIKAAFVSGSLALPSGPAGLLTLLPDLLGVWRIQAQMVADIAGAYGHSATMAREEMMYCLFRHAAAQAVRDLVVRAGERYLIRRASERVLQGVAKRVGTTVAKRVMAKSAARWLPAIGALGVAAYAFYDTGEVADTALELFASDIQLEPEPEPPDVV
jgi:hypothetical protein